MWRASWKYKHVWERVCLCVRVCVQTPYRDASMRCQFPSWMVWCGYSTLPTPEPTSQRKFTFPFRISKARKSTWETKQRHVSNMHVSAILVERSKYVHENFTCFATRKTENIGALKYCFWHLSPDVGRTCRVDKVSLYALLPSLTKEPSVYSSEQKISHFIGHFVKAETVMFPTCQKHHTL